MHITARMSIYGKYLSAVIIGHMNSLHRTTLSSLMAISIVIIGLLGSLPTAHQPSLDSKASHIIRVITTPSINTYYESINGPDGMEFQLIKSFAELHQMQLHIILTNNTDAIYSALDEGLADIALIGQPISETKQNTYHQSPSYREVSTVVVGKQTRSQHLKTDQLAHKRILAQDTEANRFKYRQLKASTPNIEWKFSKEKLNTLFKWVNNGQADYLITDSQTFAVKHPRYPSLTSHELFAPENVAIIYSRSTPDMIKTALNVYIDDISQSGELALLIERYYGHTKDINNNAYRSFSHLMRNRLPGMESEFRRVAREYDIDWRLLAAIAYQESHWDPEATSPTGVRGLMMLTHNTAAEMGVDDRLNPNQSLRGGAKYFKKILKNLPDSIAEQDRNWFALAAYNIGIGHLYDAMSLTKRNQKNASTWLDVKQHLPLLAQKEWIPLTRYGYARGKEPVKYVHNIRRYYDILTWRYPTEYQTRRTTTDNLIVTTLEDVIQDRISMDTPSDTQLNISSLY